MSKDLVALVADVQQEKTRFQDVARRVGLAQCQDPSFMLLRDTLALWFAAR